VPLPKCLLQKDINLILKCLFLPEKADFLNDYLREFGLFTPVMSHLHDDQVDPTLDAINRVKRDRRQSHICFRLIRYDTKHLEYF
jgi:hypothetical protein